tara:strand:+ start:2046 stop:2186 length:141 start_codon:yes stop_codon:yes gene_type:complete
MKDKIKDQILKEKCKDRPNYKLIQKLQQLYDAAIDDDCEQLPSSSS